MVGFGSIEFQLSLGTDDVFDKKRKFFDRNISAPTDVYQGRATSSERSDSSPSFIKNQVAVTTKRSLGLGSSIGKNLPELVLYNLFVPMRGLHS